MTKIAEMVYGVKNEVIQLEKKGDFEAIVERLKGCLESETGIKRIEKKPGVYFIQLDCSETAS